MNGGHVDWNAWHAGSISRLSFLAFMAETDTDTVLDRAEEAIETVIDRVSFIRLTPRGMPLEHHLAVLGKAGFPVAGEDDPWFAQPCDPQSRKALRLSKNDPLRAALSSIRPGGILGVPDFSHFGALDQFFDVAEKLAAKRCRIQCALTGAIIDPAKGEDVAAGARMVNLARNRRKGRTMTEARIAAGIGSGPKKRLSRSTVIRAMGVARSVAIAMHQRGEWPPAVKRRTSSLKTQATR